MRYRITESPLARERRPLQNACFSAQTASASVWMETGRHIECSPSRGIERSLSNRNGLLQGLLAAARRIEMRWPVLPEDPAVQVQYSPDTRFCRGQLYADGLDLLLGRGLPAAGLPLISAPKTRRGFFPPFPGRGMASLGRVGAYWRTCPFRTEPRGEAAVHLVHRESEVAAMPVHLVRSARTHDGARSRKAGW